MFDDVKKILVFGNTGVGNRLIDRVHPSVEIIVASRSSFSLRDVDPDIYFICFDFATEIEEALKNIQLNGNMKKTICIISAAYDYNITGIFENLVICPEPSDHTIILGSTNIIHSKKVRMFFETQVQGSFINKHINCLPHEAIRATEYITTLRALETLKQAVKDNLYTDVSEIVEDMLSNQAIIPFRAHHGLARKRIASLLDKIKD